MTIPNAHGTTMLQVRLLRTLPGSSMKGTTPNAGMTGLCKSGPMKMQTGRSRTFQDQEEDSHNAERHGQLPS